MQYYAHLLIRVATRCHFALLNFYFRRISMGKVA